MEAAFGEIIEAWNSSIIWFHANLVAFCTKSLRATGMDSAGNEKDTVSVHRGRSVPKASIPAGCQSTGLGSSFATR